MQSASVIMYNPLTLSVLGVTIALTLLSIFPVYNLCQSILVNIHAFFHATWRFLDPMQYIEEIKAWLYHH